MKNLVLFSVKGKEEDVSKKREPVKEVANAIAAGAHIQVFPIGKHTAAVDADILFIGCEVNGKGKVNNAVRKILLEMPPDGAKLVAVFSVAKNANISALPDVKSILEPKGVRVCGEELVCVKSPSGGKDFPTETDIKNARQFGVDVIAKYR